MVDFKKKCFRQRPHFRANTLAKVERYTHKAVICVGWSLPRLRSAQKLEQVQPICTGSLCPPPVGPDEDDKGTQRLWQRRRHGSYSGSRVKLYLWFSGPLLRFLRSTISAMDHVVRPARCSSLAP